MVWLGRWVFQPGSGSRKCLWLKVTNSFWQAIGQHHCLILLLATHGYWRSLGLEKQSALLIYFLLDTYVHGMLGVVATYSYNQCNIFHPVLYYLLCLPWTVICLAFQNLNNSAFSFLLSSWGQNLSHLPSNDFAYFFTLTFFHPFLIILALYKPSVPANPHHSASSTLYDMLHNRGGILKHHTNSKVSGESALFLILLYFQSSELGVKNVPLITYSLIIPVISLLSFSFWYSRSPYPVIIKNS